MRRRPIWATLTLALALGACRQQAADRPAADTTAAPATSPAAAPSAPPTPAFSLSVQPLDAPAAAGSIAPQLTSSDRGAILSWLERKGSTTTLRFAERTADGWSAPKTIASGSNWFLSYADVPTVLRKRDGTLVANWLVTTDPVLEAYDVLVSYSTDNGATWAKPFRPHHDGTKTQHGFVSFFEMPDNGIGLVWLDGREQELNTTDPEGGSMSLRAATYDAAWKRTSESAVDTRVCECCSTAAGVTADGVITVFRDRSPKEVRDIAVSRLEQGRWTPAATVHDDNWVIDACPVNGPMLSARDRTVAVAWFTTRNNQGQAWAAFSADAGKTWGTPIRLDDAGSLGYVDIELLDDGSALALWVDGKAGQRPEVRARRIQASGARGEAVLVSPADGGRPTGYPRITRAGAELVFAWTESTPPPPGGTEGSSRLRTAVARLK